MKIFDDREDYVRDIIRQRLVEKKHLAEDAEPEEVLGANRDEWPNIDIGSEACKAAKLDLIRGENLLDRYSIFTRPKLLSERQLLDPMAINAAIAYLFMTSRTTVNPTLYYDCNRPVEDDIDKVCRGFRTVALSEDGDARARVALDGRRFTYAAAVFNTTTNISGSHWVVVALDIPNKIVELWDPMGGTPTRGMPIWTVVSEIFKKRGNLKDLGYEVLVNRTRHQHGGVECGMYCIWYVWSRAVRGRSFADIAETPTPDNIMTTLRYTFFQMPPRNATRLVRYRPKFSEGGVANMCRHPSKRQQMIKNGILTRTTDEHV